LLQGGIGNNILDAQRRRGRQWAMLQIHLRARAKAWLHFISREIESAIRSVDWKGKPPSKRKAKFPWRDVVAPGLFFGGWSVIYYKYELGVALIYVSFVVGLAEIIYEPWLLQRKFIYQLGGVIIAFGLMYWFTESIVFVPAPLNVYPFAMRNGNPADDQMVNGIKWNQHFTELEIVITNPTDRDYSNINFVLAPNTWFYAATLSNNASDCTLDTIEKANNFISHAAKSGSVRPDETFEGGHFEVHDNQGNQYRAAATGGAYHLICSRFPAHFSLKITIAVVSMRKKKDDPIEIRTSDPDLDFMLGPRPFPTKLLVGGTYYLPPTKVRFNEILDVHEGDVAP
jgi:hypothetical protein